jgi:hypothetical protein
MSPSSRTSTVKGDRTCTKYFPIFFNSSSTEPFGAAFFYIDAVLRTDLHGSASVVHVESPFLSGFAPFERSIGCAAGSPLVSRWLWGWLCSWLRRWRFPPQSSFLKRNLHLPRRTQAETMDLGFATVRTNEPFFFSDGRD